MKTNSKYLVRNIFLASIIGVLLLFSYVSEPIRHGDGHEYALISQAFVDHLSPDIRLENIVNKENQVNLFSNTGYDQRIFEAIKIGIAEGKPEIAGIYRASNGRYYGYHFWIYPAYVAAVQGITSIFQANPLSSFQIANALLMILVIVSSSLLLRKNFLKSISVIGVFIFGGVLFYLKWTHPEVFIASLVYLGFIALFKRSFQIVFACFGLASTQVVSIWLIFLVIPIFLFFHDKETCIANIYQLMRSWWNWIFFLAPATSVLFYFYNFKKISLIGSGYTNVELISIGHFFSTWFDLDQGAIVGVPWILLVFIGFLINFKHLSKEGLTNLLLSTIACTLIALPLLSQVSVNSGQSVFQRYSLYASTPMIAWVGYYFFDIVNKRWAQFGILIVAISYTYIFSGANAKEDYLKHKPWTTYVLNKFPEFYNPEPGIFYARTSTFGEWSIGGNKAVAYKNESGVITKILYPINYVEESINSICIGKITDLNGTPIVFSKHKHESYGWAYMNGNMLCSGIDPNKTNNLDPRYSASLVHGIDFTRNGFPTFIRYIGGLGDYEGWGRWSVDTRVLIGITQELPQNFILNLNIGAFSKNIGKVVKVKINGVEKSFLIDSSEPKEYLISFSLPTAVNEMSEIEIIPPHPISPYKMGLSDDKRLLGLSFKKISFIF